MAAYKITVAGMIPQVAETRRFLCAPPAHQNPPRPDIGVVTDETLLDRFLLYNFFLVAMAIARAVLPQVGQEAEDLADRVCLALLGAIWCLIQAWFVAKAWSRERSERLGRGGGGLVI